VIKTVAFWIAVVVYLFASTPAMAYEKRVFVYRGTQDNFSREISFMGLMNIKPTFLAGTIQSWQIRGWVGKQTKEVTFQLYVDASYTGDWQFYDRAANDNAEDLEVKEISRNVGNCTYGCRLTEIIGVTLDQEMLEAKALSGFQIKVFGRSGGSFILDVTPAQIQSALLTANQFIPEERKWKSPAMAAAAELALGGQGTSAPSLVPEVPNFGAWGYGQETSLANTMSTSAAMEFARTQLVEQGYSIRSQSDNTIITEAKVIAATNSNADCGRMLGIPYLSDRRVSTMGFLTLSFKANEVVIKPAIAGTMKVSNNPSPSLGFKPLTCQFKDSSLLAPLITRFQGK
jgi:hypothetical protein